MATSEQRSLLQMIAESGTAGRDAWRAQQQQQRTYTADAISQLLGGRTGRGPTATLLYQPALQAAGGQSDLMAQRQAARAQATPSYGKGEYGPTAKGGYSGYKTSGDLKAAVKGAAYMRQAEDQALADQAMQALLGQFDEVDQLRTQEMASAAKATDQATADWEKFNAGRRAGSSVRALEQGTQDAPPAYEGADVDVVSVGTRSPYLGPNRPRDAEEATDRQFLRDYATRQEQTIADDWNRYVEQMLAAQQPNVAAIQALTERPLGDYAREAAVADFGIAPELAVGFFEPQDDRTDYSQQRDLESWQQFGMPYSSWISQQEDDAKAQADAEEAALNEAIYGATGYSGQQLASQVGLAPADLMDVLSSQEYADAYDAIVGAAEMGDAPAAWEAMRMASADPRIARILERTASAYIPKGYDYYGDPLEEYGG